MTPTSNTTSYVETSVKGYISDVFAMADLYLQNIDEYSTIFIESLKMTKYEQEGLKTKLMLLLSKYGSKAALAFKKTNSKKKVKDSEKKMSQILILTRKMLETNSIRCTNCNGTGSVSKVKYIREGGIITPYFSSTECPRCKGQGTMNIPNWLQDCLAMSISAANKIVQLGIRFLQTSDEIETLFKKTKT